MGEHGQGDVPVLAWAGAHLVVVQAGVGLGGLEALFDRPAGAGHAHQFLDRGVGGPVHR